MMSVVVKLVSNPSDSNGISLSAPTLLQTGQGAPAPPQPQAFEPSHVRSGWFSQTQCVPAQRAQAISDLPSMLCRLFLDLLHLAEVAHV
ncbi:hypothetical protein [Bradyrhizobium sp. CB2312]|uniref:hypothetical protein n=1 Tax=Bradyrhizobium sp. CB2312 TaxID=3039155 RepID=UPI0024B18488|nr:hypothetical protein [Bradyrhizobium sp. CB2312]WFU75040.1 hypothetical protein QA642_13925 [Bradyrhizobium sp. CB2312]